LTDDKKATQPSDVKKDKAPVEETPVEETPVEETL